MKNPEYLFETSWEVCNMVGGIYTVLSTKSNEMRQLLGDHYITVGPDVVKRFILSRTTNFSPIGASVLWPKA